MSIDLHAAYVPQALQTLRAVRGILVKAEKWAEETGQDKAEMLEWKIADDMWGLSRQAKACKMHSSYAVESAKKGLFVPEFTDIPEDYPSMIARVEDGIAGLENCSAQELNALAGNDMAFEIPDRMRMEFTVEDFMLSFSLPNINFHAAALYNILRMKGVPIGKMDWMGAVRTKQG